MLLVKSGEKQLQRLLLKAGRKMLVNQRISGFMSNPNLHNDAFLKNHEISWNIFGDIEFDKSDFY